MNFDEVKKVFDEYVNSFDFNNNKIKKIKRFALEYLDKKLKE